jgi:hypothetical protein
MMKDWTSREAAQSLGQHLAGDATDQLDEFAVSARIAAERVEDDHGPLVGNDLDGEAGGAVGQKNMPWTA